MGPSRVLVVDDDQTELEKVSNGLESAGFSIVQASQAEQAGQLAREQRPDLTIIDPYLPQTDGFDIAAALRDADVPFISLSFCVDQEKVQLATEAGALAYLVKPLEVEQLVPAVHAALVRAAELRQLKGSMDQMDKALSQGREISMVVGVLMERCNMTAIQAFDALRDEARSQRRKIADVAKEFLEAAESLHGMTGRMADRAREKAQRAGKRVSKRYPTRIIQ